MPSIVEVTITPVVAKVGEAVAVSLTSAAELDRNSPLREGQASNICLGVRFTSGFAADGTTDDHGSADGREALPTRYRLLNGTNYARTFADVVVPRGGRREFEHSFSFTLTEAGEVYLVTQLLFDTQLQYDGEPFLGGLFSAGEQPRIVFK